MEKRIGAMLAGDIVKQCVQEVNKCRSKMKCTSSSSSEADGKLLVQVLNF